LPGATARSLLELSASPAPCEAAVPDFAALPEPRGCFVASALPMSIAKQSWASRRPVPPLLLKCFGSIQRRGPGNNGAPTVLPGPSLEFTQQLASVSDPCGPHPYREFKNAECPQMNAVGRWAHASPPANERGPLCAPLFSRQSRMARCTALSPEGPCRSLTVWDRPSGRKPGTQARADSAKQASPRHSWWATTPSRLGLHHRPRPASTGTRSSAFSPSPAPSETDQAFPGGRWQCSCATA